MATGANTVTPATTGPVERLQRRRAELEAELKDLLDREQATGRRIAALTLSGDNSQELAVARGDRSAIRLRIEELHAALPMLDDQFKAALKAEAAEGLQEVMRQVKREQAEAADAVREYCRLVLELCSAHDVVVESETRIGRLKNTAVQLHAKAGSPGQGPAITVSSEEAWGAHGFYDSQVAGGFWFLVSQVLRPVVAELARGARTLAAARAK